MEYTRSEKPDMLRTDVTSVKFYGEDYILAGIGSSVSLFQPICIDICLQKIKVLNRQKIHGIIPGKCGMKILFFGGKQFSVFSVRDHMENHSLKKIFTKLFEPIVCEDWLQTGIWLDDNVVAFLTSHNIVQKWDLRTQTLLQSHQGPEKGLLYSGLLLPLVNGPLVMAGTGHSEVIIYRSSEQNILHVLEGHKGMVLSISCNTDKYIIVTTCNEKSVRIWGLKSESEHPTTSIEYWRDTKIECRHVLYEHTDIVLRSCITSKNIVTVGKDSAVCQWSLDGELLRKSIVHENGTIWCVDANDTAILTGGSDCSVIYHPLVTSTDYIQTETYKLDIGTPKHVKFTEKNNLVLLTDTDLIYYNVTNNKTTKYKLNHVSSYKMIAVPEWRAAIAVADTNGKLDIFVECVKNEPRLINIRNKKFNIGKIRSMHFFGLYLIFCSRYGLINIFNYRKMFKTGENIALDSTFILPACRKRWLTAVSAYYGNENLFVCGDGSGNVHLYSKSSKHPVKTFKRVHRNHGPAIIYTYHNEIITVGEDHKIRYFSHNQKLTEFGYKYHQNLEIKYPNKYLDSYKEMICGFHKKIFSVYELRQRCKYFEIPCGYGPKSWDAVRFWDTIGESVDFVHLKRSDIVKTRVNFGRFQMTHVIESSHSGLINCFKSHLSNQHKMLFYISGGEDSTLRISARCEFYEFRDRTVLNHLSNIITLKVLELGNDDLLVVAAGGKSQICVRRIHFNTYSDFAEVTVLDLINYSIKGRGVDNNREYEDTKNNVLVKFHVGTTIMSVDLIKTDTDMLIFAGCSDAILRIYRFDYDAKMAHCNWSETDDTEQYFRLFKEIKFHQTCILKTMCIQLCGRSIVVTCTTRGEMSFWDLDAINRDINEPVFVVNMHKSGINSITHLTVSKNQCLIATGGDDNAIHLNLLEMNGQSNLNSIRILHQWSSADHHTSSITGLCLVDKYLLSASVDQRVTLFEWQLTADELECNFVCQHWTDVSEAKGLNLMHHIGDTVIVCVFGRGMEVLSIPLNSTANHDSN